MTFYRLGILCGMLAPLLWASSILYVGSLRPDYSHFTQYISELGERGSTTEFAMRYAGFVPTGLMHMAFAAALYAACNGSRVAVIGATLLAINGLARIGAGLFPCEPGCEGPELPLNQQMHSLSAGMGFVALIGACVMWGIFSRSHRSPRWLAPFCVGCAVLGTVFLLLMVRSAELRTGTGLYERLSSGVLSLWVLVLAAMQWRAIR